MSWRAVLIATVASCLQDIRTAEGFNTNAGEWVTTEPEQLDESAAGVVAVVWERQRTPTDQAVRRTHRLTDLAVIVKLPHQQDRAQQTLDAVLEDIERAMQGQQQRFPKGISYPSYVETQPIPPKQGMGWIGAVIRYESHVPTTPSPKT